MENDSMENKKVKLSELIKLREEMRINPNDNSGGRLEILWQKYRDKVKLFCTQNQEIREFLSTFAFEPVADYDINEPDPDLPERDGVMRKRRRVGFDQEIEKNSMVILNDLARAARTTELNKQENGFNIYQPPEMGM